MAEYPLPQQPVLFHVSPEGVTINTQLGQGLSLTQFIPEQAMNNLVRKWMETRREIKGQLAVVGSKKI